MSKRRKLSLSSRVLLAGMALMAVPIFRLITQTQSRPTEFSDYFQTTRTGSTTVVRGRDYISFVHKQDTEGISRANRLGWNVAIAAQDGYSQITKSGRTIRHAEELLASNRYSVPPVKADGQITKTWNDDNNRDGIRPASVDYQLQVRLEGSSQWQTATYANSGYTSQPDSLPMGFYPSGEAARPDGAQPVRLSENNTSTWEKTLPDLHRYWQGKEVFYRIVEMVIPTPDKSIAHTGYSSPGTPEGNGAIIEMGWNAATRQFEARPSSTHVPDRIEMSVVKIWDDGFNRDFIRPTSLDVTLYADGQKAGPANSGYTGQNALSVLPTADTGKASPQAGRWTFKYSNLLRYRDKGTIIRYTIAEDPIPARQRPTLDGASTYSLTYKTLGASDYKYVTDTTSTNTSGFMSASFTNVHVPATTSIKITKSWLDSNNNDGYRPSSVKFNVYADGVEITNANKDRYLDAAHQSLSFPITISSSDNWTKTLDGFFMYANESANANTNNNTGKTITYTHREVRDYANNDRYNRSGVDVAQSPQNKPTGNKWDFITYNPHTLDTVSTTFTERWDDDWDRDNYRKDLTVTYILESDVGQPGTFREVAGKKAVIQTVNGTVQKTSGGDGGASVSSNADTWFMNNLFSNLPRYKDGRLIRYRIHKMLTGSTASKYTVRNPYVDLNVIPEHTGSYTGPVYTYSAKLESVHGPDQVSIQVTQLWDDDNNRDAYRALSTGTITLYSDQDQADVFRPVPNQSVDYYNGSVSRAAEGASKNEVQYSADRATFFKAFRGMPKNVGRGSGSRAIKYKLVETFITYHPEGVKYTFKAESSNLMWLSGDVEHLTDGRGYPFDRYRMDGAVKGYHIPEMVSVTLNYDWYDSDDRDMYRSLMDVRFELYERTINSDGSRPAWSKTTRVNEMLLGGTDYNGKATPRRLTSSGAMISEARAGDAWRMTFSNLFGWCTTYGKLPRFKPGQVGVLMEYGVKQWLYKNRPNTVLQNSSVANKWEDPTPYVWDGNIQTVERTANPDIGGRFGGSTFLYNITLNAKHHIELMSFTIQKVWDDEGNSGDWRNNVTSTYTMQKSQDGVHWSDVSYDDGLQRKVVAGSSVFNRDPNYFEFFHSMPRFDWIAPNQIRFVEVLTFDDASTPNDAKYTQGWGTVNGDPYRSISAPVDTSYSRDLTESWQPGRWDYGMKYRSHTGSLTFKSYWRNPRAEFNFEVYWHGTLTDGWGHADVDIRRWYSPTESHYATWIDANPWTGRAGHPEDYAFRVYPGYGGLDQWKKPVAGRPIYHSDYWKSVFSMDPGTHENPAGINGHKQYKKYNANRYITHWSVDYKEPVNGDISQSSIRSELKDNAWIHTQMIAVNSSQAPGLKPSNFGPVINGGTLVMHSVTNVPPGHGKD